MKRVRPTASAHCGGSSGELEEKKHTSEDPMFGTGVGFSCDLVSVWDDKNGAQRCTGAVWLPSGIEETSVRY